MGPRMTCFPWWFLCFGGLTATSSRLATDWEPRVSLSETTDSKVRVEFFVMSKCPDAIVCVQAFAPALKDLASAVDLSFQYIGLVKNDSSVCMHGPSECEGDKQQLCAQEAGNATQFLDFLRCQDEDRTQIPQNGQDCFLKAGYDPELMKQCSQGKKGEDLLRKSFGFSKSRGIGLSCTVAIDGKEFCEHDVDWANCGQCDAYWDKGACLRDELCKRAPKACSGAIRGHAALGASRSIALALAAFLISSFGG
mmetsp:Transcript_84048/g.187610  ORF Transcript_84048/g.187610 Transcript_84048/m.187610 type:complete len:252 (-) Transcript_84048:40-795(-)